MTSAEHLSAVLGFHRAQTEAGLGVCLAVMTHSRGGAVRRIGAMMAVTEAQVCGYLSNGCVDADIVARARVALKAGQAQTLHYGAGSPYQDLQLPCGGAFTVRLLPRVDAATVVAGLDSFLTQRKVWHFETPDLEGGYFYAPPTKLRICGGDSDAKTLCALARQAGFVVEIWNRDLAGFEGAHRTQNLSHSALLPPLNDDPWTAVVCLFHDLDWEVALLKQALGGMAFYLGAVGSRQTHARREFALAEAGVTPEAIVRVRGPIGLVPSTRDASRLALSTLAEIIEAERHLPAPEFAGLGALMLAAGSSRRFGAGDKLLADLNGQSVLAHSAGAFEGARLEAKLAIVPVDSEGDTQKAEILHAENWTVQTNALAHEGKASSVRAGLSALLKNPRITHILVMLGDMPCVTLADIRRLARYRHSKPIVASACVGVPMPPLILSRAAAAQGLVRLEAGESGLLGALKGIAEIYSVALSPDKAQDIDTLEDLERLNNG